MTPAVARRTVNPELERILLLPRRTYAAGDVAYDSAMRRLQTLVKPGAEVGGRPFEWWPDQVAAAAAGLEAGGGVFLIDVGGGKTLITFALATLLSEDRCVLIVPARLVEPTHEKWRQARQVLDVKPVMVWSYESLGVRSGVRKLVHARPTAIVADEAHFLRHRSAARTRRVMRYLEANPGCKLFCLSGTLEGRSLHHYAHLMHAALGDGSPLPRPSKAKHVLESWANVIDPEGEVQSGDTVHLAALRDDFAPGETGRAGFRAAFRRRLESAPGVVVSQGDGPKASLRVVRWRSLRAPAEVERLIDHVMGGGPRPDGEVFARPLDAWACARQLAGGFYLVWDWSQVTADGRPDLEWLDARRRWHEVGRRHQGRWVVDEEGRLPLDTMAQIWDHFEQLLAAQGEPRTADEAAFCAWRQQREKPEPPTVPVWVDRYVVNLAAHLAAQAVAGRCRPFLIWYGSRAMGEALEQAGIDVRGAGSDPPDRERDRRRGCVALSIPVHKTGQNLQHLWSRNLVIEPPPSAIDYEQLIGRTHRPRQPEDEVEVVVLDHVRPLRAQWPRIYEQARYAEQTRGRRQRLLYADTIEI